MDKDFMIDSLVESLTARGVDKQFAKDSLLAAMSLAEQPQLETTTTLINPEWFIKLFTKENDWILDPFVGSGTTLEVAGKMQRNSIGIDIVPEYVEMIKSKIQEKQFKRHVTVQVHSTEEFP